MKIGVISDIHDNIPNLLKSFEILNKEKVAQVFFCGDLCSCFTIDYFNKLKAPVKAVFGNNEGDRVGILERIKKNKLDFEYAPDRKLMWDITLDSKRLAVFHGHQSAITDNLVKSKIFDYVITGHTHLSYIKKVDRTNWINPGCVCGVCGTDKIDLVKSATLAIVNLKSIEVDIIEL